MNYLDLGKGVDWIEKRWGPAKSWIAWEDLQEDFAPFTAGAFMEAAMNFYRGGNRYAPSPAEMMKAIGETQARRVQRGDDEFEMKCAKDSHLWADPTVTDEDRHQTCVRCGEGGGLIRCDHVFGPRGKCWYCPDSAEVPA